jgi:RNA polymerase sigma-70 factor (ECF subfamily)
MLDTKLSALLATSDERADLTLVRRALARDADAIEHFIQRMACVPRFLAVLDRRLSGHLSREELLDLSQDTLARVWHKLPSYAGQASLETWVYRFCAFEMLNCIRRRRPTESLQPAASESRASESPPLPDVERIDAGFERLRDEEARAVRLKHYRELTFDEIALEMRVPNATAKAFYYRGMEKLRGFLRPHFGSET